MVVSDIWNKERYTMFLFSPISTVMNKLL